MVFRTSLLLVCVLALTQSICARPQRQAVSESNEPDEVSSRDKIVFFTLHEFANLANYTIVQGKNTFRRVLNDPAVANTKNVYLKTELEKFNKFAEKVEKLQETYTIEQMGELFELMVEFSEIAEKYDTTEKENPTEEEVLLEKLLDTNGMDELNTGFEKRFLDFAQNFYNIFEHYVETLNEQQKQAQSKMIDWYKKFKAETDLEKKIDLFIKFFDFVNTED